MGSPWVIDPLFIVVRLLLALLLGGLIGLEREQSNHAAGFRTHILVCIGAALIMLLSIHGFSAFAGEPNVTIDPARLAAQVISGIGFLGAGVILRNGFSVTGLTTAASLWVVAAIGLAIGAGFYLAAIVSTVLVLFSLLVLNKVEQKWLRRKKIHLIKIKAADQPGSLGRINTVLDKKHIEIRKITMEHDERERENDLERNIRMTLTVKLMKPQKQIVTLIEEIRVIQGVTEVEIE